MNPLRSQILWGLLLLPLTACGSDASVATPDPQPDPPADSMPDVQRATLSVQVLPTTADAAIVAALGWTAGIPGATVAIRRDGSLATLASTTDETGGATFDELLEGGYSITVSRLLTAEERGELPDADREVEAFGGGGYVTVDPPSASGTVTLDAGRPGALVISEFYFPYSSFPSGELYRLDAFLELYNNSDTTIYLGGKLVGTGFERAIDAGVAPCSDYKAFLEDPTGIWARHIFRFPGSKTSFPLPPGEAVVLGIDAIDHREILESSLDLSGADFEYIGTADVDNPSVPNLENVGPNPDLPIGHGYHYFTFASVPFVAEGEGLATFEKRTVDIAGSQKDLWRVPREQLLDVGHFLHRSGPEPSCTRIVHPDIDRGAKDQGENRGATSPQRSVLRRLQSGRAILLRTRTSARDFEIRAPTPGVIPP